MPSIFENTQSHLAMQGACSAREKGRVVEQQQNYQGKAVQLSIGHVLENEVLSLERMSSIPWPLGYYCQEIGEAKCSWVAGAISLMVYFWLSRVRGRVISNSQPLRSTAQATSDNQEAETLKLHTVIGIAVANNLGRQ